jgi:hypothetical protein
VVLAHLGTFAPPVFLQLFIASVATTNPIALPSLLAASAFFGAMSLFCLAALFGFPSLFGPALVPIVVVTCPTPAAMLFRLRVRVVVT